VWIHGECHNRRSLSCHRRCSTSSRLTSNTHTIYNSFGTIKSTVILTATFIITTISRSASSYSTTSSSSSSSINLLTGSGFPPAPTPLFCHGRPTYQQRPTRSTPRLA
jgi:hypothetical protein